MIERIDRADAFAASAVLHAHCAAEQRALEAAAAGVPQVAGRSGGAHEAVDDGDTGFVIDPPSDVTQTAAAISNLLADPALRARMGEAARALGIQRTNLYRKVRQLKVTPHVLAGRR